MAENTVQDTPTATLDLAMNTFSQAARTRSQLFESLVKKDGYNLINGRFGGEYNNDQLAIKVDRGVVTLLLGLKATGQSGDLQLDQMSMGPFVQFSNEWISAVIQCLKLDHKQNTIASQIEEARNTKKLILGVLLINKLTKDMTVLRIATPEPNP